MEQQNPFFFIKAKNRGPQHLFFFLAQKYASYPRPFPGKRKNICHQISFSFLNCAKSADEGTNSSSRFSEKWWRKLHIKFRRFRLNIRTSVIRNDFLLSRSILSLNCFRPWRNNSIFRTLLSKNWKAAGLIFKKFFGNYCGFGSETNEWELKKKQVEKAATSYFCGEHFNLLRRFFALYRPKNPWKPFFLISR